MTAGPGGASNRAMPGNTAAFSERRIIFLVGAVQFVNILDFMMVMPMGPDFGRALGISNAKLPMIGGAYTAAAAVSGIICALFLDRFDRRKALAVAMAGLALGTLAGAFAVDLPSLMTARIVAGVFGGPATSVALSIIADVILLNDGGAPWVRSWAPSRWPRCSGCRWASSWRDS